MGLQTKITLSNGAVASYCEITRLNYSPRTGLFLTIGAFLNQAIAAQGGDPLQEITCNAYNTPGNTLMLLNQNAFIFPNSATMAPILNYCYSQIQNLSQFLGSSLIQGVSLI